MLSFLGLVRYDLLFTLVSVCGLPLFSFIWVGDPQDTTEEDLRQANMKPGHVRRTIKALHRLRNASLISPGDPPPWSPSCSSSPVPCVHFTMANPHVADPSAATVSV